jgi:hypothetical protein
MYCDLGLEVIVSTIEILRMALTRKGHRAVGSSTRIFQLTWQAFSRWWRCIVEITENLSILNKKSTKTWMRAIRICSDEEAVSITNL